MLDVSVLRLGYRPVRDDRITTHAALVSRAFGCNKIFMTVVDDSIITTIKKVCHQWGGSDDFEVEIIKNWKTLLKSWKENKGKVVHLTMYGMNINHVDLNFKNNEKVLIVIGASKVPREVYFFADFNIAIGSQPHSEIAALSIFLDRLFLGKQLNREFNDAKMKIKPSKMGKVVNLEDNFQNNVI